MTTPKQTAVDWLIEQLKELDRSGFNLQVSKLNELGMQAREMDIQQKEYMFNCGRQFQLTGECTFKQVMDETYGKSE